MEATETVSVGVAVSLARNVAISRSILMVVWLVQRVDRGRPAGLASVMSVGSRCKMEETRENRNKVCFVWRSCIWWRFSSLSWSFAILALMYCWAKVADPMGCPRNRTPVVISAFVGDDGERKARASVSPCR